MKIILILFFAFVLINAKEVNNNILNETAWQIQEGQWLFKDGTLEQTSEDDYFPLILLKNKKYTNLNVSVNFKPISGDIDASGGLVFGASDKDNYYIVRANALEDNFRLYIFKNGIRYQIATAKVQKPFLNEYSNIKIVIKNNIIYAYLDNKLYITYKSNKKIDGFVGLWTKADSVTKFDNFIINL